MCPLWRQRLNLTAGRTNYIRTLWLKRVFKAKVLSAHPQIFISFKQEMKELSENNGEVGQELNFSSYYILIKTGIAVPRYIL